MSTRRDCREWIVQLLFQFDLNPPDDLDAALAAFWSDRKADGPARGFCEGVVRGVRTNIGRLDEIIRASAENWDVKRMGVLDRNVMRLAIYEMQFRQDIPPAVSINEAVDLAKYFSSSESGKFVNGVLDRARKHLKLPAKR